MSEVKNLLAGDLVAHEIEAPRYAFLLEFSRFILPARLPKGARKTARATENAQPIDWSADKQTNRIEKEIVEMLPLIADRSIVPSWVVAQVPGQADSATRARANLAQRWKGIRKKYFCGPNSLSLASKRSNHKIRRLKELRKEIMAAPANLREALAIRSVALASQGTTNLDCIARLTYSTALGRWLQGKKFTHMTRFTGGVSPMRPFLKGKEPLANPTMLSCTSFRGEWSSPRNIRVLGRGDFNLQKLKVGQAFLWVFPKGGRFKGHSALVVEHGKVANGTYVVTLQGHSGGGKAEVVAYWLGKGNPPPTVNTALGTMRPKPWSAARTQFATQYRVHVEHK